MGQIGGFMKKIYWFLFLFVALVFQLFSADASLFVLAVGIPVLNSFDSSGPLNAGVISEHKNSERITSWAITTTIKFGRAISEQSAGFAKLIGNATDRFIGVAGFSTAAGDIDNQQYL